MRRRTPGRGEREGPFDPGLQVERTWLAWGRTALSFVAVGALLTHLGRSGGGPLGMAPGLAVAACGVAIYIVGRGRHLRMRAAVRAGASVTSPVLLYVVTACATVSTLCGVAAVLISLPGWINRWLARGFVV